MNSAQRQTGFTLLEIMVAVFITGLLSLGVWQVMNTLMASREGVQRVSEEFRELERIVAMLERDLFQILNRPVKDAFGQQVPAVTSRQQNAAVALTRQGWRNPLGKPRSELQRVAWEHNAIDGEVIRRYWPVLDRAPGTESREQMLMTGVSAMEVRFLSDDGQWVTQWPKQSQQSGTQPGNPAGSGQSSGDLPRAFEVTFEHKRFGTIRRVVAPGQEPSASFSSQTGDGQGNTGVGGN